MNRNTTNQTMNNEHDRLAQEIFNYVKFNEEDREQVRNNIFSKSYPELQKWKKRIEENERIEKAEETQRKRYAMTVSSIALAVSILTLLIRLFLV